MKISSKNGKNSELSRCSKIGFEDFFKRYFYFSFDIFISTSRTTLMFLPTHSLMFGECLRYLQSVLKMIFTILESFEVNISSKNGKNSELSRCSKIGFEDIFRDIFTFPLIFSFLRVVRL